MGRQSVTKLTQLLRDWLRSLGLVCKSFPVEGKRSIRRSPVVVWTDALRFSAAVFVKKDKMTSELSPKLYKHFELKNKRWTMLKCFRLSAVFHTISHSWNTFTTPGRASEWLSSQSGKSLHACQPHDHQVTAEIWHHKNVLNDKESQSHRSHQRHSLKLSQSTEHHPFRSS